MINKRKWYKSWFIHNVIAHPLMQMVAMIKTPWFQKLSKDIHDKTIPSDETIIKAN